MDVALPLRPHVRPCVATALTLSSLPAEVIERIVTLLECTHDIASANATARLFRGAPGAGSPVEHALRARASMRGHALPTALLGDVRTWTAELFLRERVWDAARRHALVVAAGGVYAMAFSAFVDADGGLHTCGEVVQNGALVTPAPCGHGDGARRRREPPLVPTRVASLGAVRVRAVAAGWSHLLALSGAGAVYACGEGGRGQLGLGRRRGAERVSTFARIDALRAVHAVGVAAAHAHSLVLGACGRVLSWGSNEWGALCQGERARQGACWEPRGAAAPAGVRFAAVAAGLNHTLLLCAAGAVYSAGCGFEGRLGHGDEEHKAVPTRVEALAGVRAVHVSAGALHSLVVGASGRVHAFGDGGHAGWPDEHTDGWHSVPRPIAALGAVSAVRASAGARYSVVMDADGAVHVCGDGALRLLWLAHGRFRALAAHRAVSCALGDHALFVTADGSVHSCGMTSGALGRGQSMAEAGEDAPTWQRHLATRSLARIERLPPVLSLGGGL